MAAVPDISVLLPVYNAEDHLQEALQSILHQRFKNFELIAINDGSSDRSLDLLQQVDDPRLRIVNNPQRLKLSGALNRGLELAAGRYVARMDADDRAHPDRLIRQFRFLETQPDIDFCGSAVRCVQDGVKTRNLSYPLSVQQLQVFALFDTPVCHPTALWRRQRFEDAGLSYNGAFYPTEDFEFWARALAAGLRGCNLPQRLLDYRLHANSMTGSDWSAMDEQARKVVAIQLESLGLHPPPETLLLHRAIALHRPAGSLEALSEAQQWLRTLSHTLAQTQGYSPAAVQDVLGHLFWQLCMNSLHLGPGVLTTFQAWPGRAAGYKAACILKLSRLKRACLKGTR